MKVKQIWGLLKQPLAALIAALLGTVGAMLVSNAELVEIDPSSAAFITLLLVDTSSSENFYVQSVFRILGTILGLAVGAGISFISNELVAEDVSSVSLGAFRLSAMAVALIFPLVLMKQYSKYANPCVIYIFTVTSLIFTGSSNATTIAAIVVVVGGVVIAAVVMWFFRYKSVEAVLFNDHKELLQAVVSMAKISVRANPNYRAEYFAILDRTKSAFSKNLESIMNYRRWLRWTGRRPQFDFELLTDSLRPMYHQTASLFWSLCREKIIPVNSASDPCHLYCSTAEQYFDLYHPLIVSIVDFLDSAMEKLSQILQRHPDRLLGKPDIGQKIFCNYFFSSNTPKCTAKESDTPAHTLLNAVVLDDISRGFLRVLVKLKQTYYEQRSTAHETLTQRWLVCEYMYQLAVVLTEFLDYLVTFSETVLVELPERQFSVVKRIRAVMIQVEALHKDGFFISCLEDGGETVVPTPLAASFDEPEDSWSLSAKEDSLA